MANYRIYIIECGGVRRRPDDVMCASDQDAVTLARKMLVKPEATAEVWFERELLAIVGLWGAGILPTHNAVAFNAETNTRMPPAPG